MSMILGFDPGRDKCGVAVVDKTYKVYDHRVIAAESAISQIEQLTTRFSSLETIVMGNLTTSKSWRDRLHTAFPNHNIIMVDEKNSTLEARDRYWQMYPPQGWRKLIPHGLRLPPRPIDDIVAILLIERYFKTRKCE